MNNIVPTEQETQLLNKVLKACQDHDLEKIKLYMPDINTDTRYHLGISNSQDIFTQACLSGHLDVVKELLYLSVNHEHATTVFNTAFGQLVRENKPENYPIITYLMNEPILEDVRYPPQSQYSGFRSIVTTGINDAIKLGDISSLEILLNLNSTKNNTWYFDSLSVYVSIMKADNNYETLKYLLTNPKLKNKIDPQMIFTFGVPENELSLLEYLIFEYKIDKEVVKNFAEGVPYIKQMFELRDLNENLHINLNQNNELSKKMKL